VYFFFLGVATVYDTMASQAFGARDQKLLINWTKVAFFVMTGVFSLNISLLIYQFVGFVCQDVV